MNAIAREKSIAAVEPMGMGRIYGPMRPPTKAMGRIAAITAHVAKIVGLPTSLTASMAISEKDFSELSGRRIWRTIFSTTTMASSTRIPIEKMRAKRVMRLRV